MNHQRLLWNMHCVATVVLRKQLNFKRAVIRSNRSSCCYNNYFSCNVHAAQRTVNKMRVEKFRDRRRVEARSIFFFLSFFVVFSDTINKCSVFISFRSLYAHLPYRDRTSTTSVSAKSIRSPHPVRTCAAHRFYDPRCSHFRWPSLL